MGVLWLPFQDGPDCYLVLSEAIVPLTVLRSPPFRLSGRSGPTCSSATRSAYLIIARITKPHSGECGPAFVSLLQGYSLSSLGFGSLDGEKGAAISTGTGDPRGLIPNVFVSQLNPKLA